MSQTELGIRIGVSFLQVQKYEKGLSRISAGRLQKIARALDVPGTFFLDDRTSLQTPENYGESKSAMRSRVDPRDAEIGRRIRALRLERGWSQTLLAERIGVTFQQVQKYERGTTRIGASRLQHIAEVLGVSIASFFA